MTRQDLVNKSIDKLNTVKEALELIEIIEYDEYITTHGETREQQSSMYQRNGGRCESVSLRSMTT